MKYILLFENFIMDKPIIINTFDRLDNIGLKLDLPQVKSRRYIFDIINDRIVSNMLLDNTLYDYVITSDNEFIIGSQHYKMTNKARYIKASGEIKLNNGKISYINNESGHYKPTKSLLYNVVDIFKDENLLSNNCEVDYLY